VTSGQSRLKTPFRKGRGITGWGISESARRRRGERRDAAKLPSRGCLRLAGMRGITDRFELGAGGGEERGENPLFCGLTALMQSSRADLVSPLIISSACVFSGLAD